MAYSASVEKWRKLVEKYFKPEDVDKALYVIQGESGGNPTIAGDGGNSIGLFQMNMGGGLGTGSTVEQLSDPEYNIKLAAQAVYGGSGWGPWGEGRLYQGKPFGALGNNPYPGSTNARAPVGGAIQSTSPEQSDDKISRPTENVFASGFLKGAQNNLRGIKKGNIQNYEPTGDYATDTGAYLQGMQDAYTELSKYQNDSDRIIQVDENEGFVYYYDPENERLVVDEVGTKILARALMYGSALDRILAAKKANLIDTGESSAAAYLASEKEKRAGASEDYEDYIKRIGDITAIEDIPLQRAASISSLLDSDFKRRNTGNGPFNYQGAGFGTSGRPQNTDLGPILGGLRNVLPKSAPAPYSVNPAAYEQSGPTQIKIPVRTPEEIINEYNGGVSTGTPTPITGFSSAPPLTTLNSKPTIPIPTQTIGPKTQTIGPSALSYKWFLPSWQQKRN